MAKIVIWIPATHFYGNNPSTGSGSMKIIAFIEDEEVISKILKHLGLWEVKQRPPPRANAPPLNFHIDYTYSQIPSYEDDLYCDPDYPIEIYAS